MKEDHKKIYPESLAFEIEKALEYYPQLAAVKIIFKFKKKIKKSIMLAQPTYGSFFRARKNRSYIILMSQKFRIGDKYFETKNIPSEVLIGWIGHELGHIMDYEQMSKTELILFGIKYLFSVKSIQSAERAADTFAVSQGMGDYILRTKDFILNHAELSDAYKERIRKLYISPREVMELIEQRQSS